MHALASVTQVIMKQMEIVTNEDLLKLWTKKMAPPLVTLLSAEPEVQYVALRNINLIVQRRPSILAHEVKVFFCKYNDPIYVKVSSQGSTAGHHTCPAVFHKLVGPMRSAHSLMLVHMLCSS